MKIIIKTVLLLIFLALCHPLAAQDTTSTGITDTTIVLNEAVVQGYSYNRPLQEIPAAIALLRQSDLLRFSNTSILPVVNTIPGVRMEERSPGSFRLSIRGSSMRSPFGVRNVKVYWNGLPFTDPGGNTYINLFDFNSIDELEVIKGPGSSLYGAGTGGVLLLKNSAVQQSKVEASVTAGSYGLLNYSLKGIAKNDHATVKLQYSHLKSDGYRKQSALDRSVLQGQADFYSDNSTLSANFLYSDLAYETPGGLTLQQYNDDSRQARPAGGPNPGAAEQRAEIFNKTFYVALNHHYEWNEHWSMETGVYGTSTEFKNPAIRNYERRSEQSFGGRTNTAYQFEKSKINFGGEFQHGFSPVSVYNNAKGQTTTLQFSDEISTTTYLVFAQVEFFLPSKFYLTLGGSLNRLSYDFTRLSNNPALDASRDFKTVFSPRVALLKKITETFSAYAAVSQGYSPPTIQELYPSTGIFDKSLDPEKGNNYEVGVRGSLLNRKLQFDAAYYIFELDNTIVIRHQEDAAEYFVNAGKTKQYGLEAKLSWNEMFSEGSIFSSFKLWSAYTNNNYTFRDYLKDANDLSGNHLTGIAPHILTAGLDVTLEAGVYANFTFNFTDEVPLDDENQNYANGYTLLGGRVGYKKAWKHFNFDVFTGGDNLLDEKYSLGNDLNAVGGRFYNAAPGVNFFSGVRTGWVF